MKGRKQVRASGARMATDFLKRLDGTRVLDQKDYFCVCGHHAREHRGKTRACWGTIHVAVAPFRFALNPRMVPERCRCARLQKETP